MRTIALQDTCSDHCQASWLSVSTFLQRQQVLHRSKRRVRKPASLLAGIVRWLPSWAALPPRRLSARSKLLQVPGRPARNGQTPENHSSLVDCQSLHGGRECASARNYALEARDAL